MSEKILGVIPARGGSKRVPNKNIREVGEKPLIAHTIDQISESEMLDRTVISTEDDKIREVAEAHGGEVPFERPEELATDTANSDKVVMHAINWLKKKGEKYDIVAKIQATTPFRTSEDIDGSLRELVESDADSVISVSTFDVPPVWAVREDSNGFIHSYIEDEYLWSDNIARSQDTPELYHPNGAIFAAFVSEFRSQETFYTERTLGYEMPQSKSLDIDEAFDLEVAQALMKHRSSK
jgi:CMP-N-acetylneuraminic acid synthetase